MHNTLIITFINNIDRETRNLLELLDALKSILKIQCILITWLIDIGKKFRGLYHLLCDEIMLFIPVENHNSSDIEITKGINNLKLIKIFLIESQTLQIKLNSYAVYFIHLL